MARYDLWMCAPSRSAVRLSAEQIADDIIIRVAGHLDLSTAGHLAAGLMQAETCTVTGARLLIDLGEIEFLGVAGLRVLDAAHQRCARRGVTLIVLGIGSSLARHFVLAGFEHCLRPPRAAR